MDLLKAYRIGTLIRSILRQGESPAVEDEGGVDPGDTEQASLVYLFSGH